MQSLFRASHHGRRNRSADDVNMNNMENKPEVSGTDSDDESSSLSDQSQAPPPQWQNPTSQQIREAISNLSPNDHCRQAWEALLQSAINNNDASDEWYPFINCLCFMLFLLRYHPTLAVSRETMDIFLIILLTLQTQGIIHQNYWIPTCATTIEKWWSYFPTPPKGE